MEKFNDCASLVLSDSEAAELFSSVESLESMASIQELVQKLVPQSEVAK